MSRSTLANQKGSLPYQRLLRAVGTFLDDVVASAYRLIEEDDGVTVYYEVAGSDGTWKTTRLSYDSLLSPLREMHARAKRQTGTHTLRALRKRTHHEDTLRALGYQLEQDLAASILIDSLDDGLLVTYLYSDAASIVYRKNMCFLDVNGQQKLIAEARARCRRGLRNRFSRRAG